MIDFINLPHRNKTYNGANGNKRITRLTLSMIKLTLPSFVFDVQFLSFYLCLNYI